MTTQEQQPEAVVAIPLAAVVLPAVVAVRQPFRAGRVLLLPPPASVIAAGPRRSSAGLRR